MILDPTLSFVAIDFETANLKRESACEVGLAFFDATTRKMRRFSSRIRPPTRDFHPKCQRVHGIRWSDVVHAPTFAELWPTIKTFVEGASFLVAHNVGFDRSVLETCCAYVNLAGLDLPWECTLKLAKKLWPSTGVKLNDCAARIGFALKHHAAASDAEACGRIVVWARDQQSVKPTIDLGPSRNELVAHKRFVRDDEQLYDGVDHVGLELRGNSPPWHSPPVPWDEERKDIKREVLRLGGAAPTDRWAAGSRKLSDEPREPNKALEEIASWDPPPKLEELARATSKPAFAPYKPAATPVLRPCDTCGSLEITTSGKGAITCAGCGHVARVAERLKGVQARPQSALVAQVQASKLSGQRPMF